ncbi:PREDICTED: uncharacterized protein LOC109340146 isoform X2 [Lupinus angustifolius]|uniref:uncharacterized protein LOC109340146 isoform X2 n=1 Tax=Lupinus angustifolius TaxID=3871 RepID=UPI00092EDD20|nr:PREDICTED: uncharacterized protein LOC109340146 isoform X2 [Lupinus angustifolius]
MTDAAAVVQNRRLSIIDVSSADDSLILPLSTLSENEEQLDIFYTPNSKMFEDATTKFEHWDRKLNSNETTPSERENPKKNTKCNLRKSLAWDTAFFTNAGVLDAEELSSIIEGVEKDEKRENEEDMYKSCDSISTLGSDSLTFDESVEGDLFEDIRASIQKSCKKSKLASDHCKLPSGISGLQIDSSSKKVGMPSRNKMKAQPTSKIPTPSAGMQGLGKMTKRNPIVPQLPQPVAMRRESSISRQSKVAGKSSLSSSSNSSSIISAKKVSIGDIHDKNEKDKAKRIIGGRVSSMSKASVIGGSRVNVPKPTPPAKSPSGPSVSTKTKSTTFSPSANNSSVGKSPSNSIKRKVGTGTLKLPSSISTVRTPSRIASSNKIDTGNSSLSRLTPVTKLSSSISPTSSVSDWSSELSSSTFMTNHMCDSSRTSIDSCSSRKILSDNEADQGTNSQVLQSNSLEGQEITGFISQTARNSPGGTVLPPARVKPSGLRLPSPKIGFFDGVKSSVRTPRGATQPHPVVPRGLRKHGVGSPSKCQNKAKLGKLQAVRSIVSIESRKPNNEQVNDLHPLNGVNDQESAQYGNQVDCLSKQVGLMDINFEKGEKLNGDSLFFSQPDISFEDKSNELVISSHKELLKNSSTPCLSISPTSFDMAASIRTPLAVKDSFYNMDESVFTESAVPEVKLTNLAIVESIMEENN